LEVLWLFEENILIQMSLSLLLTKFF
jgi:hypothetical protein